MEPKHSYLLTDGKATLLKRPSLPLALALVVVLLPFIAVWARGHLFYDFDLALITAPIEDLFARYERAGELPLWAPEPQFGYPLIAISHLGFFYPLHVLLRLFLPGVITLNISLALHALLGAVGMALLLRHEGYHRESAALGALVFSGSGFFIGHLYLTNVILPLLWVPLELWLIGKWLRDRSPSALLALPVAVALMILLGQPQAAAIGTVALTIFVLASLATAPRTATVRALLLLPAAGLALLLSTAQIKPTLDLLPFTDRADAFTEKELYEFSFPLRHFVTWVFPHAFGTQETYSGEKNEGELASWVGAVVLLLGTIGLFSPRKTFLHSWIFAVLLLAAAVSMAGGKFSPFYRFLVEQQWITSFAVPARWMFFTLIAVSSLAAHGLETLLSSPPNTRRRLFLASAAAVVLLMLASWQALPPAQLSGVRENLDNNPLRTLLPFGAALATGITVARARQHLGLLLLLIAAAELIVLNLAWNPHVPFTEALRRAEAEEVLSQEDEPSPSRLFSQLNLSVRRPPPVVPTPLKRLDASFAVRQTFQSSARHFSGVQLRLHRGDPKPSNGNVRIFVEDLETEETRERKIALEDIVDREWETILFRPFRNVEGHRFRVTVDTTLPAQGPWLFFARFPAGPQDADLIPGGQLEFCEREKCRAPHVAQAPGGQADLFFQPLYPESARATLSQEILSPHIGASRGIPSSQWLGALQLRETKRYLYTIGDQNENAVEHNPFLQQYRTMVDRLNVGYLLGGGEPWRTLDMTEGIELRQETFHVSRFVRLYKNLQAYPRAHFAERVLSVKHPDEALAALRSPAFLRGTVTVEDDTKVRDIPLTSGTVTITGYRPRQVMLETENDGHGFLVLRDTFFPDWEADIDGIPTRIFRTDMLFRGVLVPPGEHTVTFRYRPTATIRAIQVSAAAWGGLGLVIATLSGRKFLRTLLARRR